MLVWQGYSTPLPTSQGFGDGASTPAPPGRMAYGVEEKALEPASGSKKNTFWKMYLKESAVCRRYLGGSVLLLGISLPVVGESLCAAAQRVRVRSVLLFVLPRSVFRGGNNRLCERKCQAAALLFLGTQIFVCHALSDGARAVHVQRLLEFVDATATVVLVGWPAGLPLRSVRRRLDG